MEKEFSKTEVGRSALWKLQLLFGYVRNEEFEVFCKYSEVFPHPPYDFWKHYQ